MLDTRAYVEFSSATGLPIRIFRTDKQAAASPAWDLGLVKEWNRAKAVTSIRRQVFERDGWACIHCATTVTWSTGEMNERQHRGQILQLESGEYHGGEISLDNSETLCHGCHTVNPDSAHGDRLPRFHGAETGRFTAKEPNVANWPKTHE